MIQYKVINYSACCRFDEQMLDKMIEFCNKRNYNFTQTLMGIIAVDEINEVIVSNYWLLDCLQWHKKTEKIFEHEDPFECRQRAIDHCDSITETYNMQPFPATDELKAKTCYGLHDLHNSFVRNGIRATIRHLNWKFIVYNPCVAMVHNGKERLIATHFGEFEPEKETEILNKYKN